MSTTKQTEEQIEGIAMKAAMKIFRMLPREITMVIGFENPVKRFREIIVKAILDAHPAQVESQPPDSNRCAVCGWTLAETADDGCVRGNCSMRPRPERLYDPIRAATEQQMLAGG